MSDMVKGFQTTKVLVVGDAMLDIYLHGAAERISPEAPVPVFLEKSREYCLGGAGNVANNAAALGGRVTLMGAIGNDGEGKVVLKLCKNGKIFPRFVREGGRPTIQKMRAISGHYQLLRVDRENATLLSQTAEKRTTRLIKNFPDYDIVVVSDYGKGFITKNVVASLKKRFGGKRIVANIKPTINTRLYRGVGVVTLNAKEGQVLTGIDAATTHGAVAAARALSKYFRASVVLTRGEQGMTVCDAKTGKISHVASRALRVFDVTGAGDTVIATLALALGSKLPLLRAAEIANRAAGIVVGLRGTAVVRPDDLKAALG